MTIDDRPMSPRQLVSEGMRRFRRGEIRSSIEYFDAAEDAAVPKGSLRPYLWQRGISYYYMDKFVEGSEQFRYDVAVNPLDVEEIVWDIACLLRLHPQPFPPPTMMSLPLGKRDRRPIMSKVYSLFRGECSELDLASAGHRSQSAADEFYSLFYLALFNEARGDASKASHYMRSAVGTKYATGFGSADYMTAVAAVHCQLRGWL